MKIKSVVVGQTVKYNQGKAVGLKATVLAVDPETGRVTLKAVKDGREFSRAPALISR